jgi:hypothetical protein
MPVISGEYAIYTHSTSAKALIARALRKLRVIDAESEMTATELKDGLEGLNQLVDSLNAEGLSLYAVERLSFPLTIDQQDYEIGPGGDLDSARPVRVVRGMAFIEDVSQSPDTEYELAVYDNAAEGGREMQKATDSDLPRAIYYDNAWPHGNLSLFPAPDAADNLILYVPVQLSQHTLPGVEPFSLPPGYAKWLVDLLVLELAEEFGKTATPAQVALAMEGKMRIQSANAKPARMRCDDAVVGRGGYDIRSDRFI